MTTLTGFDGYDCPHAGLQANTMKLTILLNDRIVLMPFLLPVRFSQTWPATALSRSSVLRGIRFRSSLKAAPIMPAYAEDARLV
jgi:hypothetical protein